MTQKHDPNIRILQLMREHVKRELECCLPGRELEVFQSFIITVSKYCNHRPSMIYLIKIKYCFFKVLQTALMPDYRSLWLKCVEVKNDLLSALQRSYPFVRLEVFGSTVMGIAFKGNRKFILETIFIKKYA